MTPPNLPREDLLAAVAEAGRRHPNWRFAQLVSNLADRRPSAGGGSFTARIEDADLLDAVREDLRQTTDGPIPARFPPEPDVLPNPAASAPPELLATLRRQIRERYGCEPEDLPPRPPTPPRGDLLATLAGAWRRRPGLRFGELIATLTDAARTAGRRPAGLYDVEDAHLLEAAETLSAADPATRAAA